MIKNIILFPDSDMNPSVSGSYNGTQLRKAEIVCPVDLMGWVELPGRDSWLGFYSSIV